MAVPPDLLPERRERLVEPDAPPLERELEAALSRSEVPVSTALLCASSFSISSLLMTKSDVLSLLSVDVSASGVFCPPSTSVDSPPSDDDVSSRLVTTMRSGSTS